MVTFLLARERAKVVANNRRIAGTGSRDEAMMASQLRGLLPPRGAWIRPCKKDRDLHDRRWCITHGITAAVRKAREAENRDPRDDEYLERLDAFIARIRARAESGQVTLASPQTVALFKKEKRGNGGVKVIYRPISVFTDLEDKILIALASRYLMLIFNSSLHEEILSYRPARIYHGSRRRVITDQTTAVENAIAFRDSHPGKDIYVAECDIQKFYDIINHDAVVRAFDTLAEENHISGYRSVRPVLLAYLDAYSFADNVAVENGNPQFWSSARSRYRHGKYAHNPDVRFCFEWVSGEAFTDPQHGCYTSGEFASVMHRLGVPQGGALSPVISDVVMDMVDRPIIGGDDPERFFNRYGDDILLMHTDRDRCHELIEAYRSSLRKHGFIYHPFEDFGGYKKGAGTRRCYWDAKSKDAFLWGPSEGQAAEWIGFVGYELHRDGAVRLRRSTLDKKFSAINSTYHKLLHTGPLETDEERKEYGEKVEHRLLHLTDSVGRCRLLNRNRYAAAQMGSLDRYRNRKIYKLRECVQKMRFGPLVGNVFGKMAGREYSYAARYSQVSGHA